MVLGYTSSITDTLHGCVSLGHRAGPFWWSGWPRTDCALFGAAGPTPLGGNLLGCSRRRVTLVAIVVVVDVDAPVFVVVRIDVVQQ